MNSRRLAIAAKWVAAVSEMDPSRPIFVFGSNEAGRHGKGAAALALRHYGALAGQGEGLQGNAYAIPTKDANLKPLPLEPIADAVMRFLTFANEHRDLVFQVTRIGCGLAGYHDEDMVALFALGDLMPMNCLLPGLWLRRIDPRVMRIIVAGGERCGHQPDDVRVMMSDLDRLYKKHRGAKLEIVCADADQMGQLAEQWAQDMAVQSVRFPSESDRYGKAAASLCNWVLAWYGTHLVAYSDGRSRRTQHLVKVARSQEMSIWVRQGLAE